jgi:hypothetical protein
LREGWNGVPTTVDTLGAGALGAADPSHAIPGESGVSLTPPHAPFTIILSARSRGAEPLVALVDPARRIPSRPFPWRLP